MCGARWPAPPAAAASCCAIGPTVSGLNTMHLAGLTLLSSPPHPTPTPTPHTPSLTHTQGGRGRHQHAAAQGAAWGGAQVCGAGRRLPRRAGRRLPRPPHTRAQGGLGSRRGGGQGRRPARCALVADVQGRPALYLQQHCAALAPQSLPAHSHSSHLFARRLGRRSCSSATSAIGRAW